MSTAPGDFEIAMLERQRPCESISRRDSPRRFACARHVDTTAATSAAISRALVVEISKYPATWKARASEAVLSSSVIAVASTLGLMLMGTGFRSYAGERRQPVCPS